MALRRLAYACMCFYINSVNDFDEVKLADKHKTSLVSLYPKLVNLVHHNRKGRPSWATSLGHNILQCNLAAL
jgi:hypothetical protein